MPDRPPKLSLKDRLMALRHVTPAQIKRFLHPTMEDFNPPTPQDIADKEWPRIEEIDRAIDGGKK